MKDDKVVLLRINLFTVFLLTKTYICISKLNFKMATQYVVQWINLVCTVYACSFI